MTPNRRDRKAKPTIPARARREVEGGMDIPAEDSTLKGICRFAR
jgi:hypothetical protein